MNSNSNGSCISGNCNNGNGTWSYPDGGKYVGSWRKGIPNGQGTSYFADGNKYEGQFFDGKRNGHGTLTEHDGDVYTGQWADNLRVGQGRYIFTSGEIREGKFVNDNMQYGKSTFPSGNTYTGQFSRIDGGDTRHGNGTFIWADGSKYSGNWINGNRARGIYTATNGERYRQVWEGDQLISEEIIEQYGVKNQVRSTPAVTNSTPQKSSTPSGRRWKKAN